MRNDKLEHLVDLMIERFKSEHPEFLCERCGVFMLDYEPENVTICCDCEDREAT